MSDTHTGLAVQVDDESLGGIEFDTFEPLFRAELERWFPGVEITIDRGTGARTEYHGIDVNDELVYECSEAAFRRACEGATA